MLGVAGVLGQEVRIDVSSVCERDEIERERKKRLSPFQIDRRSPSLRPPPPRPRKQKIFIKKKKLIKPDVWFYEAALPENLPKTAFFGGPTGEVNLGGVLAWQVRGKRKKR